MTRFHQTKIPAAGRILAAIGVACFTSLITPAAASELPTLPAGEAFFWGKEPVTATSTTRAEINLNGLWLFQPGKQLPQPKGPWGAIRVPGSWDSQNEWGNASMPGLVGTIPAWTGVELRKRPELPFSEFVVNQTHAWYQRDLTIPAAWNGRKILIDFERVSTDATVLIDGKKAGELHWPGGLVDLTSHITPGRTHKLQVFVTAVPSEKELLIAMREDYADKGNTSLRQRGIIGNVMLYSQPKGATLAPIAIRCSVEKKELSLMLNGENLTTEFSGKATATLRTWPGGEEVKKFETEVKIAPDQAATLTFPWEDPKLWDIGQPNLYTVTLRIEGTGFNDERTERFGFREIRRDGRKIFLNGREFRAKLAHANSDNIGVMQESATALMERSLKHGYNMLEIWPNDTFRRGFADFRADFATWADEKGILLMMPLIRPDDVFDWKKPVPADLHAFWLKANVTFVHKVWNSPSVALYLFFGNEFMTPDDQNPHRLGNRVALDQSQQRDISSAEKLMAELRAIDPSRLLGSHSGASAGGEFHTANHYLGITPLQEREETPAIWASSGDLPYGAVEFCTPFAADMNRARMSWNALSEPLVTEHMVAMLGEKAFAAESDKLRQQTIDTFDPKTGTYTAWAGMYDGKLYFETYQPYHDYQVDQFRRVWRSWRTYGVNLGMIQWEQILNDKTPGEQIMPAFAPGRRGAYHPIVPANWVSTQPLDPAKLEPRQRAYYEGIQPIVAYIGGPAKDGNWVAKDHHFTAGEAAEQSIVIVNDSAREQSYKAKWTLTYPGAPAPITGEISGKLPAGENKMDPISFNIPSVTEKTEATLSMEITLSEAVNSVSLKDRKSLRFHPLAAAATKLTVQAFDPEGKTTELLESLGYTVSPFAAGKSTATDLIVIGRRAMSDPDFPSIALRDHLAAGGNAVIFAQDPEFMRTRAGVRVHHWIGRQFWPVATQANHPLLADLDAQDLRDWRGSSTLLPPYNADDLDAASKIRGYPTYGYRVGGRGGVSSSAWEKPHHSGWTPLLEGEFDLAYSPLMELNYGKGLIIANSLDVEDRLDPVARMLTQRVIEYAATAKSNPRRTVFYSGDAEGEAQLKSSTVPFTRTTTSPAPGSLWILGSGAKIGNDVLENALSAGTNIMVIGGQEQLPLGITTKSAPFGKVTEPLPAWPELAGLSISDLRIRTDINIPLVQPKAALDIAASGLLARTTFGPASLVIFQGNPAALDVENKPYHRYSEWRWQRAFSQILANLGASFGSDTRFFDLKPSPFLPIELAGEWKVLLEKSIPPSASPESPSVDTVPIDREKASIAFDDSAWETTQLPMMNKIGPIDLEAIDASLWLRYKVTVPAEWQGRGDLKITLGSLDDHDVTFFNGIKIGGIGKEDALSWSRVRSYRIRDYVAKPGQENIIAIRLFDQFGGGGMGAGSAPLSIRLELATPAETPSYYEPGFRFDREMGDDPARYTRW